MGAWLFGVAILLILIFVPVTRAAISAAPPGLLAQGDEAFRHRADPARAVQALETYEKLASESAGKDAEVLWRVSMASYFVGLRLTKDSSRKERIFAQGRDAGLAALALEPGCAECHFWTAINMALYGDTVGVFKMLFSLSEIEDHLKTSLKLDPTYAGGGAYRLLGLIEQKLPGILGGSNGRAREYFEKAIAASPGEPLNYQFLAALEHDDLGLKDPARSTALKGLSITGIAPDRLESLEAQAQLGKMLKEWR